MLLPVRAILIVCCLAVTAAAEPLSEADLELFEKQVRPLLVGHCYRCHSGEAERVRAGLRLDSRAAWLAGGDSGPAIVPGRPDESRLIRAVRYSDPDLQMPPNGKLSAQEIAVLEQWVRRGAPDPRTDEPAKVRDDSKVEAVASSDFWSFRSPVEPELPHVERSDWLRSPLDRFILSQLEANGLQPAPPADKRTLIRRATFDLIGLPPTREEIAAFLADPSPNAFAAVVERLLASPHYGERWGRHWLDVARYADSNGLDENVAHGNAWRYRDYVVAAFNADKPYDQFLVEQLAGDLLPDEDERARHERLIATGLLALGPKVLAEVDEQKMEMDIVDEQIETVGKAVLGMTLGCARCHDHKFDPITTEDYYALAGVFKSTKTMETFKKIARWHENPIATADDRARKAAHDAAVAEQKQHIEQLVAEANERLKAGAPEGPLPDKPEEHYPEETRARLKELREALAALETRRPELPTAMGVAEGAVAAVPVHIRGSHLNLGAEVERRFPLVLAPRQQALPADQSGRLQLARWLTADDHPLTSRVMANRIWRWHFGRGLVPTPDNFGYAGEEPTHPELLDWLARRFVDSGWSIKAMHRLILLSSTWQMNSDHDAAAAEIDPRNRLYWRFEPRRLESEAIRDALLAVSGQLDRTMGGSLLHVKNREFLFDHTSKDGTSYDSPRRSLYLPIVRNHLFDMFELFDSPDPSVSSSDRASTTIAPQALFMMNSPLVVQAAEHLAQQLGDDGQLDERGRVGRLYELAYGRPANESETARALAFLSQFRRAAEDEPAASGEEAGSESSRRRAWQALGQAILASSEFVYVQ